MAHLIDVSTGRAAYAGVGKAWHGLGIDVSAAMTSADALRLGGQDWHVSERPIQAVMADGSTQLISTRKALIRDDTSRVLGIVGAGYQPFQNAEAYEFMDAIVGEGLAIWESVGAIKEGRVCFMLAKLPRDIRVGSDDVIKPYTLLVNSFDGSNAFKCFDTSVRVVCNNTLTAAMGRSGKSRDCIEGISIRHTGSLKDRVKAARTKLGIITKRFESFEQQTQAMAGRSLDYRESLGYFKALYPTEVCPAHQPIAADGAGLLQMMLEGNQEQAPVVAELLAGHYAETERQAKSNREALDLILGNYDNSRNRLPGIEHTAWSAYNAVSEYVDHQAKHRGRDHQARAESRLNSVLLGAGNNQKLAAYDSALALCG